jgi:siderophore synthetase component/RimJ/RimL family protein N-acetyltransferase
MNMAQTKQLEISDIMTKAHWLKASSRLLDKIIAEFCYEEMLAYIRGAQTDDGLCYAIPLAQEVTYRFVATAGTFGYLRIVPGSVTRQVGQRQALANDPLQFVLDAAQDIQLDAITMTHFIRELEHTLFADCYIQTTHNETTDELLPLSYEELECKMHGHPWFVMNKGRIGFSASDYLCYAPEVGQPVRLTWLAVARDRAEFHSVGQMDFAGFIEQELESETRQRFERHLAQLQLASEDYLFMPVHAWQWDNIIALQYGRDLAEHNMVYLGNSEDYYLPMQSIRTFTNVSDRGKHSVKLPLSIFNTAVYRGLPAKRTKVAPKLTRHIQRIQQQDAFLSQQCRLILLGEVASMTYEHPYYARITGAPYQYQEQLGVIWRDNVTAQLAEGEQAITMAALLHRDNSGRSMIQTIIEQSGCSVAQWVDCFLAHTLPPLLHFLYQYGLVFSPHGQNCILLLREGRPTGLAIKDFVDDINISEVITAELANLPADVIDILLKVSDEYLLQFIHTGLFIVFYRYLSTILLESMGFAEEDFYAAAARCILQYQAQHPQLANRFRRFDLFAPQFAKLCLNRLRVLEVGYGDYQERPEVLATGVIDNPIAGYQRAPHYEYVCDQTAKTIRFRKFDLAKDMPRVYRWMHQPHVITHWQLNKSMDELIAHFKAEYQTHHKEIFIISVDGEEVVYAETYNVMHDRLANYYDAAVGDYGWHLLIGEADKIGKKYAQPIARALTDYLITIKQANRVVFEPDHRVQPLHVIAPRLGYHKVKEFDFPEKRATLFCHTLRDDQ